MLVSTWCYVRNNFPMSKFLDKLSRPYQHLLSEGYHTLRGDKPKKTNLLHNIYTLIWEQCFGKRFIMVYRLWLLQNPIGWYCRWKYLWTRSQGFSFIYNINGSSETFATITRVYLGFCLNKASHGKVYQRQNDGSLRQALGKLCSPTDENGNL